LSEGVAVFAQMNAVYESHKGALYFMKVVEKG
jgi:hemin uptake protein HemP